MTSDLQMPPGFRFHPTDDELVMHYLCRKCASQPISVPIIAEIDLYKYDPWQLPGMALYGEKEWYFFSPRDRKYPNGSRPNRAAGTGYWKATGADKPIGHPKPVGIKKALVFYAGKAPKGEKTNWIMHEYRLADVDRTARKKNSLRLDDWVLCRIYNKKGALENKHPITGKKSKSNYSGTEAQEQKPEIQTRGQQQQVTPMMTDFACFDSSDSIPRLHTTDSSCSEHVLSSEFTCEREVQSEPRWKREWERPLDIPINNMDAIAGGGARNDLNPFSQFDTVQLSPVFGDPYPDMFMYLQKPQLPCGDEYEGCSSLSLSEIKWRRDAVEPRTGIKFPTVLGNLVAGDNRSTLTSEVLVGTGSKSMRIIRVKSLKVYAFGLYVHPDSVCERLGPKYASVPITELKNCPDFFEDMLREDIHMTVRLVVNCNGLKINTVRDSFEKSLRARLLKVNPDTDYDCLRAFGSYFTQDIPLPVGTTINFRRTTKGQLITEIGGRTIGAVDSKDLCRAFFDMYIGDVPVSVPAKQEIATNVAGIMRRCY